MMRQLRESTKVIMVVVSIAFVGLMVFEWGMDLSGSGPTGAPTSLGSVNGAEITVEEYQRQYQILYDQAQERNADGVSAEELDAIEDRAWNDVVNLTLLRQEARERDIDLRDSELVEYIRSNPPPDLANLPAFQTDGRFDLQKYRQALGDPALSDYWTQYESQLRQSLPIQKLEEQIVAGTTVTDADLLQAFRERNERARIAYLHLDPDRLVPPGRVEVTDTEIEEFYREHRDRYARAPSATIQFVEFRPTVSAADSARARSLADSLATVAREPDTDFATLAEEHSDDLVSSTLGGDLGWVRPETMESGLANALTVLEPGEVSDPIPTSFGWHVLRVEDRQTQDGETRVRARQVLVKVDPSESARQSARDAARAFASEIGSGDAEAFRGAARARDLEVQAPPTFERGIVVPGLGPAPPLTEFAFSNDAGAVSGPLGFDDRWYVVRVDRRFPAGTVALDRVRESIRTELLREERLSATREMAPEIADAVRRGGLERAAREYGLEVRSTDWFTRTNDIPDIGSGTPVAGAAFGLAQGQTAGPIETERGTYFIRTLEKQPVEMQVFEAQKEELRRQLRREQMVARFNAWFEATRERAEITDNRAAILGA